MIRKNIYNWHRKLSIIIAFPVLIWAISGFIHPIMTNIRPHIATQQQPQTIIDTSLLKVPLDVALKENSIDVFYNCRIIELNNHLYYQIKKSVNAIPVYFSTLDGKQLQNGDTLYAIYLANHFASDKKLDVESISYITDFTDDYNNINKLLPVYRVCFKRKDGISIYVDTQQSRFSFATNNTRSILTRAFTLLHTWSWLGNLTLLKIIIMTLLMLFTFINGVVGLYIFFTTKSKNKKDNKLLKRRRNHRFTAVFASLFILFFSFSGCVHTLAKLRKDDRGKVIASQNISRNEGSVDIKKIQQLINLPIHDISFVKMNGQAYLRVAIVNNDKSNGNDLMKQMREDAPKIFFIDLSTYSILQNGEEIYAGYLANNYLHQNIQSSETVEITAFDDDYDFADKVLPVWKIKNNSATLYVETSTAKLRKASSAIGKFDDYSFAFFHKHEFMMFAGKSAKDISTMFWVAAQIVMIVFGLVLYFNRKKKSSVKK
ncbi:MAG: PepSY-associated TM helix domain-containing protein [Arachidicoccus sp.]|nr:PepSY-associated TM helix domain-containing protein [Arachidicoccus sp.]